MLSIPSYEPESEYEGKEITDINELKGLLG